MANYPKECPAFRVKSNVTCDCNGDVGEGQLDVNERFPEIGQLILLVGAHNNWGLVSSVYTYDQLIPLTQAAKDMIKIVGKYKRTG